MEPRPHERGKRLIIRWIEPRKPASMEPRPHERGKLDGSLSDHRATVLQWSHVLTNVESENAD